MKKYLKINKYNIISFVILIFAGYITVFANPDIGTDIPSYIKYFNQVSLDSEWKMEPAFQMVALIFSKMGLTHHLLFSFVYCGVVSGIIFSKNLLIYSINDNPLQWALLLGLFLASSWFYVAVNNAIRHGIAAPLLWISLIYLYRKTYILGVFFLFLSFGFHFSSLLVLASIAILYSSHNNLFYYTTIAALGYITGAGEWFISQISDIVLDLFSINIYYRIKYYGFSQNLWRGFQWDLFIYSYFFVVFYWIISFYFKSESLRLAWRVYCILIIPYFLFGFGGFSNRYAFSAWLIIPLMHYIFLFYLPVNIKLKKYFSILILIFGIYIYTSRFNII